MTAGMLHAMLVHFPIAFLIAALAFDVVGFARRKESFFSAALYVQTLGVLGAIAAVLTGNRAEEPVEAIAGIEPLLERHELLGQIVLYAGLAVLAVRLVLVFRRSFSQGMKGLIVGLSLGLAVLVGLTAFYGGQMVYDYGAGAAPVMRGLPSEH